MQVTATDDFTITWPDPDMATVPWVGDRMHFPGPTVQLAQHLIGGFQERVLGAPTIFANGYEYSVPPTLPETPAEVVERGLQPVWYDDYAPRIREFCERVRATDFDAMSAEEILEAFEMHSDEALECLRLTLVVVKAFMQPTFGMLQFLEDELGADGPALGARLLQGYENATADSGSGIGRLSAMAAQSPELAEALTSGSGADFSSVAGGAEFQAELDALLAEFGWRAETWGTLQVPTWAEDSSGALALIARYVEQSNGNLADSADRSSDQRDEAVAAVESRLDAAKLDEFRGLIEATQQHVAVSEDRARWQLSAIGVMRLPALALGRKLVEAGALESAEDVFFLTLEEVQRAIAEPGDGVREAAASGREDFARWEQLAPPPFLGVPPDPAQMPAEMLPMIRHFFGLAPPSVEDGVVSGVAASPGTVTGRARVIKHLDESDRLEPGDIMVCVTTAPPWTALFAIAGAVVTDTGGVMSHSGICAREFAIPCVVGTQVGTHAIPDGATITVDGEAGTVTIVGD